MFLFTHLNPIQEGMGSHTPSVFNTFFSLKSESRLVVPTSLQPHGL